MAFRMIKNYLMEWVYSRLNNADTSKQQTDQTTITTNTLAPKTGTLPTAYADSIDCNTANIKVMKSMLNRIETANSVMQQQINELQAKQCNILSAEHRTVIENQKEACLMQERIEKCNPKLLLKWTGWTLFALMFGWFVKNSFVIEKMSPNAI